MRPVARAPVMRWSRIAIGLALALSRPPSARAAEGVRDSLSAPPERHISYGFDAFEKSLAHPLARTLDPSQLVRKLSGRPREAVNADEQDRVRLPSTWWQPRLGYKAVSVEELTTGPGPGTGPAPGPWSIVGAKTEGVSKGFQIKDATGARFAIKFDPMGYPELATSPDVIASKLYWAAGYNVPDNAIAFFRRESLTVSPKATCTVGGKKQPMTEAFLGRLLQGVPRRTDGSYRVVASRFLDGKPLGEWRYDARREDDPDDQIPHELRREIRGMWVINAWLDHTDCSARNTLDMYVTDGGRSFVRHHLLDFSGCLGSASIAPQTPRSGHEYFVDYGGMARSLFTLGLAPFPWERELDETPPGIGVIESATFKPAEWRPYLPNPAFDELTERDIRWGASIVAAFTDEHIRAAVACGHYSDPRAAAYLVRVLEERRDLIVQQWLTPGAREPKAVPPDTTRPLTMNGVVGKTAGVGADNFAGSAPTAPSTFEPAPHPGVPARMRRAAGNFLSDGWVVISAPARVRGIGLVWMGAAIAAEAVLFANDQAILDASLRNRDNPEFRAVLDVGTGIEPVGFMGRTNPLYLTALGAGYAFKIPILRTLSTEILESHLIAGGVRNLGKAIVGRRHPYDDVGPYQFGHGTSFPSGHTSVGFELATIASMNAHSLPVTMLAYTLATTLALQRIESRNHWPSDVFISAVYGTAVARTVVNLNERRTREGAAGVSIIPELSSDGHGMAVRLAYTF